MQKLTVRKFLISYLTFSAINAVNAAAGPLEVTSTADTNTTGTLRFAINHANADALEDAITFNIPGEGPHQISLTDLLPLITDDNVSIDGTTQSGASCGNLWGGTPHSLMIQIDTVRPHTVLRVGASNVAIKGLSIANDALGIGIESSAVGTSVQCNYIGVFVDGSLASASGLRVLESGTDSLIGGPSIGEGNVIGGGDWGILTNSSKSISIVGNFFGTDPTGIVARRINRAAIGNVSGITTINEIRNNLISGNGNGFLFQSDDSWTGVGNADGVIAGNYIGTDRTGNAHLPNTNIGINFNVPTINNFTIGGTQAADRNVISGNGNAGIFLGGASSISILGNYIGVGADGTTPVGNGGDGILARGSSDISIGHGTSGGRNVISGNSNGINLEDVIDIDILGNYVGLGNDGATDIGNTAEGIRMNAATNVNIGNATAVGRNTISGNAGAGITNLGTSTNVFVKGNYIGLNSLGTAIVQNDYSGLALHGASETIVGGLRAGEGNLISNTGSTSLISYGTATTEIIGNTFGLAADGNDLTTRRVNLIENASATVTGNTFRNSNSTAISVTSTGPVAILGNSISNANALGIDLGASGATVNDSGDADTGPNDLLNFPLINSFTVDGSTSVTYDINLDLPSVANGYRIEFFKNTNLETYGEGEFYLGFLDVAHAGGDLNFTGSFTANAAVSSGDYISATTTRKTGVANFDVTSEFALTYTAQSATTQLIASQTIAVFDPEGAGLYAIPGNDMILSLTFTNTGAGSTATDSIVVIKGIPAESTFYNGDIDDSGPETQAVSFAQTNGTGLTFNYGTDVRFSNDVGAPVDFAACTYVPAAGYDLNVKYICLNPKGEMQPGFPDPTATLSYRTRIN